MSKEYLEALDEFLKDYLFLCEKLHTNMQEKMLLDGNSPYNVLKTYLESIDNANPSEALKCLEKIIDNLDDYADFEIKQEANEYIDTIKQTLLKAQEPKQYLKWENLEFKREEAEYMKVSLNGTKYCLVLTWGFCEPKLVKVKPINLYEEKEIDGQTIFLLDGNYINDVQFFNDLHLERVEE